MEGTILEAKDAVKAAFESYVQLSEVVDRHSIRLEEIELLEEQGEPYWLITFSRPIHGKRGSLEKALGQVDDDREYKVFKVLAQSGRVVSMKIRQL